MRWSAQRIRSRSFSRNDTVTIQCDSFSALVRFIRLTDKYQYKYKNNYHLIKSEKYIYRMFNVVFHLAHTWIVIIGFSWTFTFNACTTLGTPISRAFWSSDASFFVVVVFSLWRKKRWIQHANQCKVTGPFCFSSLH